MSMMNTVISPCSMVKGSITKWATPARYSMNQLALNYYTYCAGDPVNYTDPTGHNFLKRVKKKAKKLKRKAKRKFKKFRKRVKRAKARVKKAVRRSAKNARRAVRNKCGQAKEYIRRKKQRAKEACRNAKAKTKMLQEKEKRQ